MQKNEIIETIAKFRWIDKYATFCKLIPGIENENDDHKEVITEILDRCCNELIDCFRAKDKPLKTTLKEVITQHMNMIYAAKTSEINKDFGYELCWYISDKIGLRFKLQSGKRAWGYWAVEGNIVKQISGVRSKKKTNR